MHRWSLRPARGAAQGGDSASWSRSVAFQPSTVANPVRAHLPFGMRQGPEYVQRLPPVHAPPGGVVGLAHCTPAVSGLELLVDTTSTLAARYSLDDLHCFTVLFDKMADVDGPVVAAVRGFANVGWRWVRYALRVHRVPSCWAGLWGVSAPAGPFLYPTNRVYTLCTRYANSLYYVCTDY